MVLRSAAVHRAAPSTGAPTRRPPSRKTSMKAWQLERLGGELSFKDVRTPEPRPGSVLVRIEASALMSYLQAYVEGKLPVYNPPPGPFTIGTNGAGGGE